MSNLFTQQQDNIIGGARGRLSPASLFLFFFLFIVILGFLPAQKLYITKLFLSQWFLAGMVMFFFVRSFWLKTFLLWITIRMAMSYKELNNLSLLCFFSVILALLFYQFIQDKINRDDFLNILCVVSLTQLVYVYVQILGYDALFKVNSLYKYFSNLNTGFMGNTNLSGILLAVCMPAFFRRGWCKFLPLFIYGLYKVNCITACLGLGIGIVFYLYHRFKIIWPVFLVSPFSAFLDWNKISGFMAGPRVLLWKEVFPAIKRRLWFGYGIGQYRYVSTPIVTTLKRVAPINWSCAHNDLLQIWTDAGLIVVLCLLGFALHLFLMRHNDYILSTIILIGTICSMGFFVFYTPIGFIILGACALLLKKVSITGKEKFSDDYPVCGV